VFVEMEVSLIFKDSNNFFNFGAWKQENAQWKRSAGTVVEYFPGMCKALGSILSTTKRKEGREGGRARPAYLAK
jgi:hypothetical protein